MDKYEKDFMEKAQAAGFTQEQAAFLWNTLGGGQWRNSNAG